ncbi:kinase-like protein, partial [Polyplosphaeria fusca]
PQYNLNLHSTASMINLNDGTTWTPNRGPPSPTLSTVSGTTSRSATPTTSSNPWSNPWNTMTSPPPTMSAQPTSSSPRDSPNRTPQYTSRSTTPVPLAPQPLRPINPGTGFVPITPPHSSSEDEFRGDFPRSPISIRYPGSPNPYRQNAPSIPTLANGIITPAILSQSQSLSQWFYDLCRRQGWPADMIKKIWHWCLSNPRTALLLVLCDDVASWRHAKFFDLRDENLPFTAELLDGIVEDARKVVNLQWRVTAKELPLKGSHVDFNARETVPLERLSSIKSSGSPEKSLDRVRLLGDSDERVLVRKRFVLTRPTHKANLLKQIQDFKSLEHKNIGRLLCSYAQPSHVGIVSAAAQYSLDDFLSLPGDNNRPRLLLDWMHDLSQALVYLHGRSITHRAIRPRKILIDGSRVFFAAFGIGPGSDTLSPTMATAPRADPLHTYFQDQSYIYAAPEVIAVPRAGKKPGRSADVFSLGCVFLNMMTVIQNIPLSMFTHYRTGSSHDSSFHAHLDRVGTWRTRLVAAANAGLRNGVIGSGRKQRQLKSETEWLGIIEEMMQVEPTRRTKMRRIASHLADAADGRGIANRRKSLDGGYSGQVAPSLRASVHVANSANSAVGANGTTRANGQVKRPDMSVFDGWWEAQEQ